MFYRIRKFSNFNPIFFRTCGGCVMPVNCELEPDALEQQIGAAKVKVRKFHVELFFVCFLSFSVSQKVVLSLDDSSDDTGWEQGSVG